MAARNIIVVCLMLCLVASAMGQDITLLLQNREVVHREIGCVLRRNPCDIIGRQIKALLPEAIRNNCARCTPQQAANANKLMSFMRVNYPNEWRSIVQMYGNPRSYYNE